jgi:hypothetical protein
MLLNFKQNIHIQESRFFLLTFTLQAKYKAQNHLKLNNLTHKP